MSKDGEKKDTKPTLKFYLSKAYLNKDGYTRSGEYYGAGRCLYKAEDTTGDYYYIFGARDRKYAREYIERMFPNYTVKFFN